jgi:hypothetical protein
MTHSRLLRRSLETLREGGLAALLWQTLATAGARRLQIHARPAERQPARPVPGVGVRALTAGDAAAYRVLGPEPQLSEAEFSRRLRAGHRCFGAWRQNRLIAVHWLAFGEARISYLGVSLTLGSNVGYDYEAYTAPPERRRGVGNLLGAAARAAAAASGKPVVLAGILPENRGGAAFIAPWSRNVGTVTSVRLGRWRISRSSVPPAYIRRIRPLPTVTAT